MIRVERHVSTPGLEHGQDRRDQAETTLQAEADAGIRGKELAEAFCMSSAQPVCHLVGRDVEFGIGQGLAGIVLDDHVVGGARHLCSEQRDGRGPSVDRVVGGVGSLDQPFPLGCRDQLDAIDRLGGIGGECGQCVDEVIGKCSYRTSGEQGCIVMQGQLQRLAGQHHQEQREARLVVNTGGGGPEDFVGCTNRRVVLEHRDAVEQGSIGRQLAGGADIGEREVAVLARGFDRGVQGSQGLCDCDARLVSSPDRHDVRGQSDETIDVGKGIGAPRDDRTEDDVPRAAGVAAEQAGPGELDHRVEGDAFVSRQLA